MLDFVNHYYEVTEENIDQLKYLIECEDIRDYGGEKLDLDFDVRVGYVLGNIGNDNPKQTGLWCVKSTMIEDDLVNVTTELPNMVITIR